MKVTTVRIDLAKSGLQIHGVDERGKAVLKKQLKRDQVASFFANFPTCLIGMEACGSAHHWTRKLQSFGHTVKLMGPQFVKAYAKTNRNDVADAEAICEAVARSTIGMFPDGVTSRSSWCARTAAFRTRRSGRRAGSLARFLWSSCPITPWRWRSSSSAAWTAQYAAAPIRGLRHQRDEGAAFSGVPSLSVLDGWWIEGCIEGVTGRFRSFRQRRRRSGTVR